MFGYCVTKSCVSFALTSIHTDKYLYSRFLIIQNKNYQKQLFEYWTCNFSTSGHATFRLHLKYSMYSYDVFKYKKKTIKYELSKANMNYKNQSTMNYKNQ